jgi:hypothetical protein
MALLLRSDSWDQILGIGFSGPLDINIGANRPQDTGGKSTAASSNFEGFGQVRGQMRPAQAAPLI